MIQEAYNNCDTLIISFPCHLRRRERPRGKNPEKWSKKKNKKDECNPLRFGIENIL
jgi:hypothetical protein